MNTTNNSIGIVTVKTAQICTAEDPLLLDSGEQLGPIDIAYETYGTLNADKSNVILINHALTGDAHAAGYYSDTDEKPGWWDTMIGPGKAFDTNKYYLICSNVIGGCKGSTGPMSINPKTSKPWGLTFPIVTIRDMVHAQKKLLDHLGITRLLAVAGGSMGGMQVLQWAVSYPETVRLIIAIATTSTLSTQNIAFNLVGRQAIFTDPNFKNGEYYNNAIPEHGLAVARMIGHITYLSEKGMRDKFGRRLQTAQDYTFNFGQEFEIESYLQYQGKRFSERFDANSYFYVTKAMDYFDLAHETGSLETTFAQVKSNALIISFTSDWLFSPEQSKDIVRALIYNKIPVSYCNIYSPYGHDAFLLEAEQISRLISGALYNTFRDIPNQEAD